MKKTKVILSALLMAAAINFTACSNASAGSSDPSTPATPSSPSTPSSGGGSGSGSGSGGGSQTPAITYIGSKAPSEAKEVGDIVFNDGSAAPGKNVKRLTDAQKKAAVAVIFYTGTGLNNKNDTTTVRTLGIGLKHYKNNGIEWCKSGVYGYNYKISEIQCSVIQNGDDLLIQGDLNGSDNFSEIAKQVKSSSSAPIDEADYPAFQYANNYSNAIGNSGVFNTNWFLPSLAELYQLYVNGIGEKKSFDIDSVLGELGGDKFGTSSYWTSSQADEFSKAYIFAFGNGSKESALEDNPTYYACAIRDFTTYTVTTESTAQVTITADKETATAGEKVTLTYTPAAPDDYDVTFNGFTVLNGSKAVKVEADNSFIMPAGNVNVSADIDYEDLYKITISSGTGGSVTASKTKGIKAGDEITLTVTPDVDNGYKLKNLTVMNGETPVTVSNKTFTMPAANVTITAAFWEYCGSKKPSEAKEVGDIVFNDGSTMSYSEFKSLDSDEQADLKTSAIALIFYTGTGLNSDKADGTPDTSKSRTLGIGLKNSSPIRWCNSNLTAAYSVNIETIQCTPNGTSRNYTFTGDKNGSDNLEQIATFLGSNNDTGTEANYPALYFAKNYSNTATNLGTYNTGWYLPSIAEIYQIYVNGVGSGKSFDITQALTALGGDSIVRDNMYCMSSSQNSSSSNCIYSLSLCTGGLLKGTAVSGKDEKFTPHSGWHYCCAIREFN